MCGLLHTILPCVRLHQQGNVVKCFGSLCGLKLKNCIARPQLTLTVFLLNILWFSYPFPSGFFQKDLEKVKAGLKVKVLFCATTCGTCSCDRYNSCNIPLQRTFSSTKTQLSLTHPTLTLVPITTNNNPLFSTFRAGWNTSSCLCSRHESCREACPYWYRRWTQINQNYRVTPVLVLVPSSPHTPCRQVHKPSLPFLHVTTLCLFNT